MKGSYFLSTSDYGSHNMVFGYDNFNDIRQRQQSPVGQRLPDSRHDNNRSRRRTSVPVFTRHGRHDAHPVESDPDPDSEGSDFRTHSVFFNDSWRVNNRLTANLGVRYDKNDGKNQAGEMVAKDDAISPPISA